MLAPALSVYATLAILLSVPGLVVVLHELDVNSDQNGLIAAFELKNADLAAVDPIIAAGIAAQSALRASGDLALGIQAGVHWGNISALQAEQMGLEAVDDNLQFQLDVIMSVGVLVTNSTIAFEQSIMAAIVDALALEVRVVAMETKTGTNLVDLLANNMILGDHEARITALEATCSGNLGGVVHVADTTTLMNPTGCCFIPAANMFLAGTNSDGMIIVGAGATIANAGTYLIHAQIREATGGGPDRLGFFLTVNGAGVGSGRTLANGPVSTYPVFYGHPLFAMALVQVTAGQVIGVKMATNFTPVIAAPVPIDIYIKRVG